MIGRRVPPLLVLVGIGTAVLLVRLGWIQLHEHEFWAVEAARLVHSGSVVPYERGPVLDDAGRVLARDKETYSLALVYRDFRRRHPLGQVAHARSLLEGRAVSLEEARLHLLDWALEITSLTPRVLEAYGEGRAVRVGTWSSPALAEPARENRARRASDVRFYLGSLLGLEPRAWTNLKKGIEEEDLDSSFLELAARQIVGSDGEPIDAAELWRRREERLARSVDALGRVAERLEWAATADGDDPRSPLDRLVDELEAARRWVEDATASKLFAEATGFAPGRIDASLLAERFDLSWIARILAWDDARLTEWAVDVRTAWLDGWRDGYAAAHLLAQLWLEPASRVGPDSVLDRLAAIYAVEGAVDDTLDGLPEKPTPWRRLDRLAVLDELPHVFEADVPRPLPDVLPVQSRELRDFVAPAGREWIVLDRALNEPPASPDLGAEIQRRVAGGRRSDVEAAHDVFLRLADDWEKGFQARLRALLVEVRAGASPRDLSDEGRLLLREGLLERAEERADFFLKDFGLRPRSLLRGEPDYEVVALLTRFPDRYPGFEARDTHVRVHPVAAETGERVASALVGDVSTVNVFEVQRQRGAARRLRVLRNQPWRSQEEEDELRRLVGRVVLHDEKRGVAGVEGFFDQELRGSNGYRENWGLQEALEAGTRKNFKEPVDGEPVRLTLDLDLQLAAERTLRSPMHVDDPKFDEDWAAHPVGAIVLVAPDGDVLAAASEPNDASRPDPEAVGQRALRIERTLRQPTFQPPGSCFKPFVAAYALDRAGLDPSWQVTCGPIERGGSGYVDVRCHQSGGHGPIDLDHALIGSCNAYFAALGESLSTSDFHVLARIFGFGEPTGIRTPPPWDSGLRPRLGLFEDVPEVFAGGHLSDFQRRLAGNGLGVVEATPLQIARATIGLATGVLPSLRLVSRVGDREVPGGPTRRLELGEAALERVRRDLYRVTTEGTAREALRPERLGFPVAAKTGSADLTSRRSGADDVAGTVVRKHTWVTGWVPEVDPVAIFVVFVHDTHSTSSHGAIHLARQFLEQPEVRAWLDAHGVEGAAEGGLDR